MIPLTTPVDEVRFVVLDTETTGLDPRRDRIITIGAVGVVNGEIDLADSFEALLQVAYNSSAVTVHGVTRDQAREGYTEREALTDFLSYLQDGVIVGHHIGHDVEMVNQACLRNGLPRPQNLSLDTMDLTLHLEADGAFAGGPPIENFSLDSLCARFGIEPHDRHTAGGDAFLTALVFQRLLRLCRRVGRRHLSAIAQPFVAQEK